MRLRDNQRYESVKEADEARATQSWSRVGFDACPCIHHTANITFLCCGFNVRQFYVWFMHLVLSFISHFQINLEWLDTCSRVSVGTSVRKDSSTLCGNAASPVLSTASSVWRQTDAWAAARDTNSETTSAALCCAARVRRDPPQIN